MKITHSLKLKDAEEFTRFFLESLTPLREAKKLGPILFQLAPTFKADLEVLDHFSRCLPKTDRYAFEFRHASWFSEEVYEVLRRYNVGLCQAENEKLETPDFVTADFVYLRLRKPDYDQSELAAIKSRTERHQTEGRTVYAIFKHEDTPAGALNAEKLLT